VPTKLLVPPCGAWFGAYVGGSTPETITSVVTGFEASIGRPLDIVYTYHDMSDGNDGQLLNADEEALGKSRTLMISWSTDLWNAHSRYSWRDDIASGKLDAHIDQQAKQIKAFGRPVMLAFDPEMDIRFSRDTRNAPDYIAAYRHVHDRFAQDGVTNVIWMFIVTGDLAPGPPAFASYYPGDEYVDWIGFDLYNFYKCWVPTGTWKTFEEAVKPTYDWLETNGFGGKPMMLSEYSSMQDPQNATAQADWFRTVPQVVKTMPNIKAIVQWDALLDSPSCDLTVNRPDTKAAFKSIGADPYFHQPRA
jgi:hypothetical protein